MSLNKKILSNTSIYTYRKIVDVIIYHNNTTTSNKILNTTIKYYIKNISNVIITVIEQNGNSDLTNFKNINHIKVNSDYSYSKCFNLAYNNTYSKYLILINSFTLIDNLILKNIIKTLKNCSKLLKLTNIQQVSDEIIKKPTAQTALLVKRDVLYKIGGYNENLNNEKCYNVELYKRAKQLKKFKHVKYHLKSNKYILDTTPCKYTQNIHITNKLVKQLQKNLKYNIHFLHVNKTGGGMLKSALINTPVLIHHGHLLTLKDISKVDKVFFFLRNPIDRYISGFNHIKRLTKTADLKY